MNAGIRLKAWESTCGILARLAQADVVFWLLPPLMALLVAGTLAQAKLGLYAAQKMFFASVLVWAGPLPLPGGYLLTGSLATALACKFLLQSPWSKAKAGILLTHLGVLVLLAGGLIGLFGAREGFMALAEGEKSNEVYDYQERILTAYNPAGGIQRAEFKNLQTGSAAFKGLPFALRVKASCANCAIARRNEAMEGTRMRGMARFMALESAAPSKEPESDLSGVTFEIAGAGGDQDGFYIAFEGMPKPVEIKHKGGVYGFIFGKALHRLPFAVRLEDFEKKTWPGMDKPRAFLSRVSILDGGLAWPALIEMNKPLRYKGYTFYQSSFDDAGDQEISVFSVVRNRGRLFPYIGTALIACGLLLHAILGSKARRTS
jgi:hypothetical protein